MSRFYGSVQGDERSEATRTAHRTITAHPRGWDLGVKVNGYADTEGATEQERKRSDSGDTFAVSVTGGSHGNRAPVHLVQVAEAERDYVRVSVLVQDGGRSVYYLDRDGETHTRPHETEDRCALCIASLARARS